MENRCTRHKITKYDEIITLPHKIILFEVLYTNINIKNKKMEITKKEKIVEEKGIGKRIRF